MNRLCLICFLCSGCSLVKELKKPPFPYAVTHHSRVVGIETTIPNQAGDAVFKLRLGFFSDTTSLIPCATNDIRIPAISDTFRLGQNGMDTTITEDLQTGFSGAAPTPRYNRIFEKPTSSATVNEPQRFQATTTPNYRPSTNVLMLAEEIDWMMQHDPRFRGPRVVPRMAPELPMPPTNNFNMRGTRSPEDDSK